MSRFKVVNNFILAFLFFSICSLYLIFAFKYDGSSSSVSGWFVPDGISLWISAMVGSLDSIDDIRRNHPSMWVFIAFVSYLVGINFLLPAAFNFILIVSTFVYRPRFRWWAPFVLFLLPYYILSFPLPSKDLIVVSLFAVLINFYIRRDFFGFLMSLIISILIAFVRDGFGVMIFFSIICIEIIDRYRFNPVGSLIFLFIGCAFFWLIFEGALSNSFVYERSMAVAESGVVMDHRLVTSPIGYLIRLFGNSTNLAFRPIFLNVNGGVDILSVCYFISGLTLLVSIISCGVAVLRGNLNDVRIGMIGIMSLLLVSITPYVQPRYLFPLGLLMPLFSFASIFFIARMYLCVIFISTLFCCAYLLIGNYPPLADSEAFFVYWGGA